MYGPLFVARPVFIAIVLALSITAPWTVHDRNGRDSSPTVHTKYGSVAGVHNSGYDQDFFLGLPYARPPLGDLRFANPVAWSDTFNGTWDASRYSAECVGYGPDNVGFRLSEDCLYLNIIRPSGYEGQSLPVAVWIYGGGFSDGGSSDIRYNLSFIVENSVHIGKPIIAISINYRVGALGFMWSNELAGTGSSNMGLRDQRMALQWIQGNIADFGGDPRKVTIWGESAGAASVGFQLLAFGGRNDRLFRAGIMQSGNPISLTGFRGLDFYQPMYDEIVAALSCTGKLDTLACLRQVPFDTLNDTLSGMNPLAFQPVVDGDFVQKYGSLSLSEGKFIHVPIINGANSDEGTSFSPQGVDTTDDFFNYLTHHGTPAPLPSAFAQQLLNAYPDNPAEGVPVGLPADYRPGPPFGAQFRRSAAYYGDAIFIATRRHAVSVWARAGIPAYSYRFNALPAGIPQDLGVNHFQEVAFVFANLQGKGYSMPPFKNKPSSYAELSRQMAASWTSFVHDLDPNTWRRTSVGANTTGFWPVYSLEAPQNFVWDANVSSYAEPDTFRAEGIDLINANHAEIYHR